jgi:flagellar M-ring protein FliF
MLSAGAALILAIMAGIWLWGQQPEYKVLFSNFNDRDGGAIVASLQQMNIPYKYSESGSAILVPASQVHDARLKLASQGLPKGGNVGFELMENQKLEFPSFSNKSIFNAHLKVISAQFRRYQPCSQQGYISRFRNLRFLYVISKNQQHRYY